MIDLSSPPSPPNFERLEYRDNRVFFIQKELISDNNAYKRFIIGNNKVIKVYKTYLGGEGFLRRQLAELTYKLKQEPESKQLKSEYAATEWQMKELRDMHYGKPVEEQLTDI